MIRLNKNLTCHQINLTHHLTSVGMVGSGLCSPATSIGFVATRCTVTRLIRYSSMTTRTICSRRYVISLRSSYILPLSTLETRNKRLIPRWDPLAIGRSFGHGGQPLRSPRSLSRYTGPLGRRRAALDLEGPIATRRSTPEGRGSERTCVPLNSRRVMTWSATRSPACRRCRAASR